MRQMKKAFLTLTVITLLFLLVVGVHASEAIPKPSVPQFTLEYVVKSYDVPPVTTSTTDPYTNKTTTTTILGYHVDNLTIEVTIKNQPFPSIVNGNFTSLYYNVRTKGHYGEDWTEQYPYLYRFSGSLPTQSSSENTVLSLPSHYRVGDKVDFQLEAVLGYEYSYYLPDHIDPIITSDFVHESSGWSNTQTITIPESSASPSTAPTSTPILTPPPPTSSHTPSPSISPSPTTTPSPFATQQPQPEPTQTNLLPYVLIVVAALIIAFIAGVLVTLRVKKPKAK